MLSAFTNCFKIPELRQRIILTLGLIFIARVGAGIPLPGVDPAPLAAYYASASSDGGGLAGLYNMFTGGAMVNGAVFALGHHALHRASIILQLMGGGNAEFGAPHAGGRFRQAENRAVHALFDDSHRLHTGDDDYICARLQPRDHIYGF